jgi:hypothetical protein
MNPVENKGNVSFAQRRDTGGKSDAPRISPEGFAPMGTLALGNEGKVVLPMD